MTQLIQLVDVPAAIESKLRSICRRNALLRGVEGVLITALALVVAMMVAMTIDWLVVLFDQKWRGLLTLSALTIVGVVFVSRCLRLMVIRQRFSLLARKVDQAVPELEERWSTVTELADSTDPPRVRGAQGLIRQVSYEAEQLDHLVTAKNIVSSRPIRRWAVSLGVVLIILLLAFMVATERMSILMRRFWAPGSNITLTRVIPLPGDKVVPKGEPLTLEARIEGRQETSAELFTISGADEQRLTLVRSGLSAETLFKYQIRSVIDSFDYRFRSGDGQTRWHRITAADRPSITQVRFRITPPAYSGLPVNQEETLPHRCRVLKGSRLELSLQSSKPLAEAKLKFNDGRAETLNLLKEQWYRYETTPVESLFFSILLVDQHGLVNVDPPSCRVLVYADKPPLVKIVSPDQRIVVAPDDTITIDFKAEDDFGISAAELLVTADASDQMDKPKVIPIPLSDQKDARSVQKQIELDLKSFDLKHGSQLTYAVRVTDTRDTSALSDASGRIAEVSTDSGKEPGGDLAYKDQPPGTRPAERIDGGRQALANQSNQSASSKESSCPPKSCCLPGDMQAKTPNGKKSGQQEDKSAERPPNNMTGRQLNTDQCSACSEKHHLLVDKWAGSFQGQARKKLQIAIDQYLKKLDALLTAAQEQTNQLSAHVRAKKQWDIQQTEKITGARQSLADVDQTVCELNQISADTPYAFIGLQLRDINISHVSPARKYLADASGMPDDPDNQISALDQAAFHVDRARALLAGLTKQYEQVKREEKLAEAMERVAKMHQIFIEDMYALLKACKPKLNPRTGKMVEVDDQMVESLKQYYEQLKELMGELSKVLADDPDLLRRYMAAMRLQGMTLRDQLTVLAKRQNKLHEDVGKWINDDNPKRPALQDGLLAEQIAEQSELATSAAQLYENMITWVPRDMDASKGPLAQCRLTAKEVALSAREIFKETSADRIDRGVEIVNVLVDKLESLHEQLAEITSGDERNSNLAIYVANRMAETENLILRQIGWVEKIKDLRQGKFGRAMAVDQDRLAWDTDEFGGKLDRAVVMLSRLSAQIEAKARELAETVGKEVVDQQLIAMKVLDQEKLAAAHKAQGMAVTLFARSEKLFDELLTMVEEAAAAMPPPTKAPPLPTLEQLLAMLEKECKACEKLGAVLRLNIAMNMDWMGAGDGSGAGAGDGSGSAQGNQSGQPSTMARMAQRMAEAQARAAVAHAEQATKEMEQTRKQIADNARMMAAVLNDSAKEASAHGSNSQSDGSTTGHTLNARDFNVLVSTLEEELRQGRNNIPPEQYRQAIEAYFRNLGEMSARPRTSP